MVVVAATHSATPTVQAALGRAKLQQARREADQAENTAQNLREQADVAEQEAQNSKANVRTLASQIEKVAAPTYASPRLTTTAEVPTKTQDLLVDLYSATSEKRAANGNSLKSNANAAPIINAQGQATGRIVNISA